MAPLTPPRRAPLEAKAQAAGLSGAAAGIVLWILQTYLFKGSTVPAGLVSLIDAVVPGVIALLGAYFAPHTPRPAPQPLPPGTVMTPVGPVGPMGAGGASGTST